MPARFGIYDSNSADTVQSKKNLISDVFGKSILRCEFLDANYFKKGTRMKSMFIAVALLATFTIPCLANGWFIDFEGGMAFPGYNDVQVPNDSTGTRFSLADALNIESKPIYRIRAGYETGKNTFSLFAAPLSLEASGILPDEILFAEETFAEGTEVDALYRFDSYRATWRYLLVDNPGFLFKLGFTAKIRDAEIRVESDNQTASTTNTGFVPLLSFELRWVPAGNLTVLLEGDALVGPVGRAEDVFLGGELPLSENIHARVGYRIVEGGADVESVYNFTLVNFATAGVTLNL